MFINNIWPVVFFGKVISYLAKTARTVGLVVACLLWCAGFIDNCIIELFTSINLMLGEFDVGGLGGQGTVAFATLEYIGYINAFLPVGEFVGLVSIYLTAWSFVIIIRWTKSFVPFFSN